jgi:abhydrolase domain-containing protein 6
LTHALALQGINANEEPSFCEEWHLRSVLLMYQTLLNYLGWARPDTYRRTQSLILVNGLAEQGESWYPNRRVWGQQYDVHTPGVIVYGGDVMQQRLATRQPINIAFLTDRLAQYLDQYVQSPPYHLVASSLGGQFVG